MLIYLYIPAGFLLLVFGGNYLVTGAVGLANRLGVSPLIIGATIVSYGTTSPELVVSLDAALSGAPGIAIGNVVGSNICNFLLILGTAAVIFPIVARADAVARTGLFLIGATMLLIAVSWTGYIGPYRGALLLIVLVGFTWWSFMKERDASPEAAGMADEAMEIGRKAPRSVPIAVGTILAGVGGVVIGAHLLVTGAIFLAREFGVDESIIGLTVVAIGTSLPEYATAVTAALRRHPEVALGNVLGANIYNILAIMGLVSLVSDIPVPARMLEFDLWFLLAMTVAFIGWLIVFRRLSRAFGIVCLVVYLTYVASLFLSGRVPAV
ncbi:MAG: calcium/sodium antiporter [Acetobacterales bacterium]